MEICDEYSIFVLAAILRNPLATPMAHLHYKPAALQCQQILVSAPPTSDASQNTSKYMPTLQLVF